MSRRNIHQPDFYLSAPSPCGYLAGRQSRSLFVDPFFPMDTRLYTLLARHGFRRSGAHVYRPQCEGCRACTPVRVPVARFRPDRRQRRCLKRNADLQLVEREAEFDAEHFHLFERYLAARHPGGGMDEPTREDYLGFIRSDWSDTVLYEFRQGERLLAVTVMDRLPDALSAVYTFFDPAESRRSPGRYAVLTGIRLARETGRNWLYLGYWIAGCAKMRYKDEYRPLEYLGPHGWSESPPDA